MVNVSLSYNILLIAENHVQLLCLFLQLNMLNRRETEGGDLSRTHNDVISDVNTKDKLLNQDLNLPYI